MNATKRTNRSKGMSLGVALVALSFVAAACSQDTAKTAVTAAPTDTASVATAAANANKPAPFKDGEVKIAVVQNSGAGDYFQQWTNGAKQQADAIGISYTWYDA